METVYEKESRGPVTFSDDYVPESPDEYAFRQAQTAGEICRIGKIDEDGHFHPSFLSGNVEKFSSYEDVLEKLKNARQPLEIPSYIPEGYEFESALLVYYLSPGLIDPYMSPFQALISQNGNEMQTFRLPGGYDQFIESCHLYFKDGDGNTLLAFYGLEPTHDTTSFQTSPDAAVTAPKIGGFQGTIYVSEVHDGAVHSYVAAQRGTDPVGYYSG